MLDLDEFAAVFGSADPKLLERILTTRSEQIVSHDNYLRLWEKAASYTSLRTAIEQIFEGQVDNELRPRYQFEHAAGIIAEVLGVQLESPLLTEASEDFWAEVDTLIVRNRGTHRIYAPVWPTLEELLERGPYLPLPMDRHMRLGSGYLTADEVKRTAAALRSVQFTREVQELLQWPDEAMEALEEYRGWSVEAAEQSLGLFFHC